MCGIVGYLEDPSLDAAAFGRALDVMERRGPDNPGIFDEPEVLFTDRRLVTLGTTAAS